MAPYLVASVASIRKYFPQAKIITYVNSMPASASLIEALASVRDADGKVTDYASWSTAMGLIFVRFHSTLDMVEIATDSLCNDAVHYPHMDEKSNG